MKSGNNFTRHHLITHTNKLKLFSHQMISKISGSVLLFRLWNSFLWMLQWYPVCQRLFLDVSACDWPRSISAAPSLHTREKTPGTKGIATHDNKSHNLITRMKNVGHNYHDLCSLMKLVWYLYHNSTKAFCVWVIVLSNNLQEQPSLLAPRRLGHFVRRDACTSVTEIPHWWRKICQECGQELRLVDVVVTLL